MKKFETSDEFFDWFLPEMKKHVPNLDELAIAGSHNKIVHALPNLTPDQIDHTFSTIREIITIPDNVFLVYDNAISTYASRYNTSKRRLEIIVPTYAYYHLRYDPVIKAAIQHEMGHILNRDYKVDTRGHSNCANRCMDIRINHHIDREWLDDLFNAVYYFKSQTFTMLVPEEVLPAYNLPLKKHGTYSYQVIHKYYHFHDKAKEEGEPQPKPPKEYIMPKEGDIVRIDKTKKYGKVVEVQGDRAIVEEMTVEQVKEHFK